MATPLFNAKVLTINDSDHRALAGLTAMALARPEMMALEAASAPSDDPTPPLPDYEPTVYTIRFTPELAEKNLPELRKRTHSVERFRTWATFITNQLTQKKIDSGDLPNGGTPQDKFKVGTYRSKVMDAVYTRRAPWLALNAEVNNYKDLQVKSSEFRKDIIALALVGFAIPVVAMTALDKVLDAVVQSISHSQSSESVGSQYWIQFVIYDFNPMTQEVTTRIRTISFMTTSTTTDVAKNCSRSRESHVLIGFTGTDYNFNFDIYDTTEDAMTDQQKKDAAEAVKNDPTFDVPV